MIAVGMICYLIGSNNALDKNETKDENNENP